MVTVPVPPAHGIDVVTLALTILRSDTGSSRTTSLDSCEQLTFRTLIGYDPDPNPVNILLACQVIPPSILYSSGGLPTAVIEIVPSSEIHVVGSVLDTFVICTEQTLNVATAGSVFVLPTIAVTLLEWSPSGVPAGTSTT